MRETLLVRIHALGAALVDHALGVAQNDVLAFHSQANVVLGASDARGSGAIQHHANLADVLADHFQAVQQGRARDDRGAVLVIVKDRNLHRLSRSLRCRNTRAP